MRFCDYIKDYNNELFDKIKNNRELIIESFVRYYGEKYRKLIEEKFDKVIFYSFVSENTSCVKDYVFTRILEKKLKYSLRVLRLACEDISSILFKKFISVGDECSYIRIYNVKSQFGLRLDKKMNLLFGDTNLINSKSRIMYFNKLSGKEQYYFAKRFYGVKRVNATHINNLTRACNYSNAVKNIIRDIDYNESNSNDLVHVSNYIDIMKETCNFDVCSRLVGSNSDNNYYAYSFLNGEIRSRKNACTIYTVNNHGDVVDFILLPILITTDFVFFHELNHQIVTSDLAIIDSGDDIISLHKSGIAPSVYKNINFEELLNQKTQIKITSIFHELGGKLFEYEEKDLGECCCYDLFFPLIDNFFDRYEDILKDVRISFDHNLLYKYVDKDVFLKYMDYVNDIVTTKMYDKGLKPYTKYEYDNCNKMIDEMDKVKKLKL